MLIKDSLIIKYHSAQKNYNAAKYHLAKMIQIPQIFIQKKRIINIQNIIMQKWFIDLKFSRGRKELYDDKYQD